MHDTNERADALQSESDTEIAAPRTSAASPAAGRVPCPACGRANPLTRHNCLYCGATLPQSAATEAHVRLKLRPLDPFQQGFNVVLLPAAESASPHAAMPPVVRAEVERLLGIEEDMLERISKASVPIPLARVADEEEALLIERRIAALSLSVVVLPDAEVRARAEEVKRVRQLEIAGDSLRLWCRAGGERTAEEASVIRLADIIALVRGHLLTKEVDKTHTHKRGRRSESSDASLSAASKADERELFADESVLDIYAVEPVCTWRISAGSFDYSCLGARRALLARDNFELIIQALRLAASTARFDDSYRSIRNLLEPIWASTERTDARGTSRRTLGRVTTQTATFVNNEDQFTRYARTCAHVERERRRQPERAEQPASGDIPCT